METIKSKSEIILQQYLKKDISYTEPDDFVYVKTALQAIEDAFHDAQRWISVNEELPSPNSEFIHTSLFVLVKTDIDFIRTATYNHQKRCFVTERGKQLDKDLGNVTHWRYIELK